MIHIKRGLEEGHCGLIPLGGPCSECWTSGLHWNLGIDHLDHYVN